MNYYEKIIRKGVMAADEYKKKDDPIEGLNVSEHELETLELSAILIIEDLGDPFDPTIK